ncbi:MAG: UvrD-helicase domain-containing protein [Deltaproteobacteria bacterium]|nr:UvrD-helicase domain-containing protein [Deltaproteobacteria bacterium]RLC10238.1 MAG: hypothetical protein DRH43_06760 [Deltaproteobacteria bacterium]
MAGPGTGKTFALMRRVARLLQDGATPNQMLVCTFTRTAARDLESELARLGVDGANEVRAGTLHAFCFGLLGRAEVLQATGRVPRPLLSLRSGSCSKTWTVTASAGSGTETVVFKHSTQRGCVSSPTLRAGRKIPPIRRFTGSSWAGCDSTTRCSLASSYLPAEASAQAGGPFWKLAQALFEVLPRDLEDWKLVNALLSERETMKTEGKRVAYKDTQQAFSFQEGGL